MENASSTLENLLERVEEYGRTTFELSKLKALDTSISITTSVITRLSVIALISMFVLIFSLGIAMWLGAFLGKYYLGFIIVSSFYLLAAVIMHFFLYDWIKKPLNDSIISKLL